MADLTPNGEVEYRIRSAYQRGEPKWETRIKPARITAKLIRIGTIWTFDRATGKARFDRGTAYYKQALRYRIGGQGWVTIGF